MIIGICMGIILTVFIGDLWIKNYIEANVVDGETIEKLGGKILIRKHHNKGAALNIGERKKHIVTAVSLVLTIVTLVVFILSLGQRGSNMLRIGLSLLLGGAFSNTYDRLKRKYVVDYVSFGVKWKRLRRIIFNCSDFCIIIGALLTALEAAR